LTIRSLPFVLQIDSIFPFSMDLSLKHIIQLYKNFIASLCFQLEHPSTVNWITCSEKFGALIFCKILIYLADNFDGRDVWRALMISGYVIGALRGGDANKFNLWEIIYRRTWHEMCQTHLWSVFLLCGAFATYDMCYLIIRYQR
jgi:hypothetical protein